MRVIPDLKGCGELAVGPAALRAQGRPTCPFEAVALSLHVVEPIQAQRLLSPGFTCHASVRSMQTLVILLPAPPACQWAPMPAAEGSRIYAGLMHSQGSRTSMMSRRLTGHLMVLVSAPVSAVCPRPRPSRRARRSDLRLLSDGSHHDPAGRSSDGPTFAFCLTTVRTNSIASASCVRPTSQSDAK